MPELPKLAGHNGGDHSDPLLKSDDARLLLLSLRTSLSCTPSASPPLLRTDDSLSSPSPDPIWTLTTTAATCGSSPPTGRCRHARSPRAGVTPRPSIRQTAPGWHSCGLRTGMGLMPNLSCMSCRQTAASLAA